MTVREAKFEAWLQELKQVFITGYGYSEKEAQAYVYDNAGDWSEYYGDEYTPRQTAAEDMRAGAD